MTRFFLTCILSTLAAATMTGCFATTGKLDNRLVCTVAGDALYMISEYGPVGISSRISEKDREKVCK